MTTSAHILETLSNLPGFLEYDMTEPAGSWNGNEMTVTVYFACDEDD